MRLIKLTLALWFACGQIVNAQQMEQGVIVSGEGRVSVAPDMATITLGVRETADTAKEAMSKVTESVAQILPRLNELGVAASDQQTSNFFLRPVYDNRLKDTGTPPSVVAYEAGNSVTVTVRDLTQLGVMLDAVIDVGANDFNGLEFGVQDDSDALAAARALAVADARSRATQIADAAEISLGSVLRITENSFGPQPLGKQMSSMRAMEDAIATGEVDVQAQVTITYAIAP